MSAASATPTTDMVFIRILLTNSDPGQTPPRGAPLSDAEQSPTASKPFFRRSAMAAAMAVLSSKRPQPGDERLGSPLIATCFSRLFAPPASAIRERGA